ncbi:transcriptional regulator, partial [Salmonella enterica]|nr:transcriptional regulator [Salmonella enterica]
KEKVSEFDRLFEELLATRKQ